MKRLTPILATLVVLAASGCAPSVDIVADRAAIREAERQVVKAANGGNVEQMVATFAVDAAVLPPNAPAVTGKESIREWAASLLESPGFAVKYQNDKTELSRAGDLGYTISRYELTVNDPEGNPVTEKGRWVTVWKKQADGTWKCVLDIWNSDQPTASE